MRNKLTITQTKTKRNGKPVTRIDVMTQEDMDRIYKRKDTIETIFMSLAIGATIAFIFALGIAITPNC